MFKQIVISLKGFFNMFEAKGTTTKIDHIKKRTFIKLNSFQQLSNLYCKWKAPIY